MRSRRRTAEERTKTGPGAWARSPVRPLGSIPGGFSSVHVNSPDLARQVRVEVELVELVEWRLEGLGREVLAAAVLVGKEQ